MIVMNPQCGEKIVIGGNVVLTIVAIGGDKIRVGVDAPRMITVDRQEIHARRLAECECDGESNHRAVQLTAVEA